MKFKVGDNVKINLDESLPTYKYLKDDVIKHYGNMGKISKILTDVEYTIRVEFPNKTTNDFKECELLKTEIWDN